jgi:DNA-binding FadR family transcriptional regulator
MLFKKLETPTKESVHSRQPQKGDLNKTVIPHEHIVKALETRDPHKAKEALTYEKRMASREYLAED